MWLCGCEAVRLWGRGGWCCGAVRLWCFGAVWRSMLQYPLLKFLSERNSISQKARYSQNRTSMNNNIVLNRTLHFFPHTSVPINVTQADNLTARQAHTLNDDLYYLPADTKHLFNKVTSHELHWGISLTSLWGCEAVGLLGCTCRAVGLIHFTQRIL